MRIKHVVLCLSILTCFLAYTPAKAQNVPGNMSSVNVDDLSDAQIEKLMQQEAAAGLTDDQLVKQLELNGLSADQGDRLKTRIEDLRNGNSSDTSKTNAASKDDSLKMAGGRKLNYKTDTANKQINFWFLNS